jgi:hypothetical protein
MMVRAVSSMSFFQHIRTSKSTVLFSFSVYLPGQVTTELRININSRSKLNLQEAPVTSSDSQPTVGTPSADYVAPYAPNDMGHAMVPHFVPFHFSLVDK